ncbi:MAG: DUF1801 domain-containing protein [Chloroflexota bacterium]|nr:DUF1801 domain-containing protein [Chloroflexota bacterium]
MEQQKRGFRSIDEYIATFPEHIQALLESLRATIKAAAPGAEERISYQMPTFVLNGYLVYFAAWKNHIGFYPASSGVQETFKAELSGYATEKGTVRFPINEPLPLELISKIVQFRVSENLYKAKVKARKNKASTGTYAGEPKTEEARS